MRIFLVSLFLVVTINNNAQTFVIVSAPTQDQNKTIFVVKKQDRSISSHINPKHPITHFFLNFLGIMNIIKGSSVQVPVLNWVVDIGPRVNYVRILTGFGLLLASRILRAYETERDEESDQNE